MNKIETIIFDLGGVLIDWNPRYLYRNVFDDQEEMEYFLEHVCSGEWNGEQDRGRSFEEAILIKQKEFPHYNNEIELFFSNWHEMISGCIQGSVDILDKLYSQRKLRLYALTNWSHQTFPYALENFEFLKRFEGILVSGKENLIKPNPAIYHLLLSRFDIIPERAIFIDDSLKNIEAANKVGLHGLHFSDSLNLKKQLYEYGINV